ncbi:uncharacterized protein K444DRAFT_709223 [Hyaloscypha bicolor E]|uniref:Uncharacterized protein n=1 Tax=Hyaloscypha bicolor E TaxID=1095630 RepID=A0A2J6SN44_9HELO|nr:uncharacterized protein K444DRAFT_709223 [Hyaloscypha bicolor E]PMD52207.1 hypothetical protein K444DRAFT_709223 [Hyaloscypha bicolor E]
MMDPCFCYYPWLVDDDSVRQRGIPENGTAVNWTELLPAIAQQWQQHRVSTINDQRSSQLGSVTSVSVKPRKSGGSRHDDHRSTARMQALRRWVRRGVVRPAQGRQRRKRANEMDRALGRAAPVPCDGAF